MSVHTAEESVYASVAAMLCLGWGFFAWQQPTDRVYTVLLKEYNATIPWIRQVVGPLPPSSSSVTSPQLHDTMLAASTARVSSHIDLCYKLLEVRGLTFAGIFLVGFPLIVATWQLGKARQCARMRRGIAPSPRLQFLGVAHNCNGHAARAVGSEALHCGRSGVVRLAWSCRYRSEFSRHLPHW